MRREGDFQERKGPLETCVGVEKHMVCLSRILLRAFIKGLHCYSEALYFKTNCDFMVHLLFMLTRLTEHVCKLSVTSSGQ